IYENSIREITLDYIIYEFNKSNRLFNDNKNMQLILNETDDLTIEYIKAYARPYLTHDIKHELLAVCATNGRNAYYFVIDRGAVNFLSLFTKIRIIYYHSATDCDPNSPYWLEVL